MATLLVKGLIGIDDMSVGTGTFTRSTSTGGTATLTQVDFVRQTSTGTQTLASSLVLSTLTASGIVSRAANPAQSGTIRLGNNDSIVFRNFTNSVDITITSLGAPVGNRLADALRFANAGGLTSVSGFSSESSQTAASGLFRLASAETVSWRNNANNADVPLGKNTIDQLTFNSQVVPSEATIVDLTAQNAAIGTTTLFAVVNAGQYRVSWNAKVTTAAGSSSTLGALTITYTDPDGVVQTITCAAQISAGTIATTSTGNSTTTVLLGVPMLLNCKAGTNIQYAFAYASNAANAMQYNLHIRVEGM